MGYARGLGACVNQDPQYPSGCPSGFTLQQVMSNGKPFQLPDPAGSGVLCNQFACMNSAGQTPFAVTSASSAQSTTTSQIGLLAAAGLSVFLLPGPWKLLSLGLAAIVLTGLPCPPFCDANGQPLIRPAFYGGL